jgi:hypothetical protein
MSAVFTKAGIRFQYPENWTLVDESLLDWPRTVSLQSPGGGFWSLMKYDRGADVAALLRETLNQMREEYDSLESSVITEQFDDISSTGYEMYFYCLDFLVCAKALAIQSKGGDVLLLLWQAEDREFTKYEPIFRAITTSLLRELQ